MHEFSRFQYDVGEFVIYAKFLGFLNKCHFVKGAKCEGLKVKIHKRPSKNHVPLMDSDQSPTTPINPFLGFWCSLAFQLRPGTPHLLILLPILSWMPKNSTRVGKGTLNREEKGFQANVLDLFHWFGQIC